MYSICIYISHDSPKSPTNPLDMSPIKIAADGRRPQGVRSADPPPRGLLLDLGPGALASPAPP